VFEDIRIRSPQKYTTFFLEIISVNKETKFL
jgi:hypothetical protein